MNEQVFWHDDPHTIGPPLTGDVRCDIAVVGAGVCGTAAALSLARQGIDVRLLEAERVAACATGRNAGFILQGTAERYDRAIAIHGRERARRVHAFSLENHDRIAAVIAEERISCGYRRGGSLQLASTDREAQELVDSTALLRQDGFEADLIPDTELPPLYRTAGFRAGVVLPMDGELHPAAFTRGAARAAARHGAHVHEGTRVTELDASSPGDVRLRTAHGSVRCAIVLVCANARVGALLPWFADKVDPVRGQMLATAPAPRLFDRPIYANHGYDYWRQDPDGRVVLGGWRNLDPSHEVGFARTVHADIQARMTAFLQRFPPLADVPITHRWSGIMGFSRDGLPLVGPAPSAPGALAAVGFTGHGFGFAWLAGEALAAVALDGRHPFVDEMDPRRLR